MPSGMLVKVCIWFRMDGKLYNLRCLQSKTKTPEELLFGGDWVVFAHTKVQQHNRVGARSKPCRIVWGREVDIQFQEGTWGERGF